MRATRLHLARLSLVLTVSACSEDYDDEFGGSSWSSEHFSYRYHPGDPLACREVLPRLEAYSARLGALLGVQPEHVTYYKYESEEAFRSGGRCRTSASACSDSASIHARVPLHGHEVVHTVMAARTSTSVSRLLAEGLANALTCQPGTLPREPAWDFRSFGSSGAPTEQDVTQAGRLVLGLLQHVTPVDLMNMLDRVDENAAPEALRQALSDGWDVDLDRVQAEVEERGLGACVPWVACGEAELANGEQTLRVGCHGFDAATLPTDGAPRAVRATGSSLRFMTCDLVQSASPLARISPYRAIGDWEYWLRPPSSRHALWFDDAEQQLADREARVALRALSGAFEATCDDTSPEAIASGRQVAIVIDGSEPLLHFPLAFDGSVELTLDWQKGPDAETYRVPRSPVAARWCHACSAGIASDCVELDRLAVEQQTVPTRGRGVLVLQPSAALGAAAVLELTPSYP